MAKADKDKNLEFLADDIVTFVAIDSKMDKDIIGLTNLNDLMTPEIEQEN